MSSILALAGVVLGFMLGEGSRWLRYKYSIRVTKSAIRAELEANLGQLPQKIDILQQSIAAMKKGQVLSMQGVHFVTTAYESSVADIYPHISIKEKNALHVTYETFRIADEFMDKFEDRLVAATKDEALNDPWTTYINKCSDLAESLNQQKKVAESYLGGNPVDVFGIGNKS